MRLRPVFDRVVIRQLEPDEKTVGGIMLPNGAKTEDILRGKVIAVGPGRVLDDGTRTKPEVCVGDIVTFATRVRGAFAKVNGKELLIMEQADILAVVEDDQLGPGTERMTGDAYGIEDSNGEYRDVDVQNDREGNR
jgi:chaperonin GroES